MIQLLKTLSGVELPIELQFIEALIGYAFAFVFILLVFNVLFSFITFWKR